MQEAKKKQKAKEEQIAREERNAKSGEGSEGEESTRRSLSSSLASPPLRYVSFLALRSLGLSSLAFRSSLAIFSCRPFRPPLAFCSSLAFLLLYGGTEGGAAGTGR